MAVGKWAPLVAVLFVNAMAVGGMDIEQTITNLTQSLAHHYMGIIAALQEQIGSTYVRWGRTTCPENGTTIVYSGYMAGSNYHEYQKPSSGSNYMCLPVQPTWDYCSESVNSAVVITGVQYDFYSQVLTDFFESDVHNKPAPCALCRTPRSSIVMIPGRTNCYPGWSIEYSGYLVAALPGYDDSSEFFCLDRQPEVVETTGHDYGNNRLHFVKAMCGGSFKCPPYVHGGQLACVVCSI